MGYFSGGSDDSGRRVMCKEGEGADKSKGQVSGMRQQVDVGDIYQLIKQRKRRANRLPFLQSDTL